jgi:hypothetical protein
MQNETNSHTSESQLLASLPPQLRKQIQKILWIGVEAYSLQKLLEARKSPHLGSSPLSIHIDRASPTESLLFHSASSKWRSACSCGSAVDSTAEYEQPKTSEATFRYSSSKSTPMNRDTKSAHSLAARVSFGSFATLNTVGRRLTHAGVTRAIAPDRRDALDAVL